MVFSSVTFVLVFLPIVLITYLLLYLHLHTPKHTMLWCNSFLLIASLLFYAWGEPKFVLWLVLSMLFNFHIALLIAPTNSRAMRKFGLSAGLILNLLLLGYFKYLTFFMKSGFVLLEIFFGPSVNSSQLKSIALPLGISFYTFQAMSYLIDVYRDEVPVSRNIINFGCYLTMFPQLVAGPIVRYISIQQELEHRKISPQRISNGIGRFIIGLSKKLLIADTLGRVSEQAFAIPTDHLSPLAAWAGVICYTLQIYYDFSGYSDMAIGLGHIFGFTFPENFNYPYISKSIKEFWRRWHITLSSWFKDYLYIPLGGNRHGLSRTVINLLIVFTLCGLWHGSNWVFITWGLYHGCFLVLERFFPKFPSILPLFLQHLYTILVVALGWIFFKATSLTHAKEYFYALISGNPPGIQANHVWLQLFSTDVYIALLIGMVGCMPIIPYFKQKWEHLLINQKNSIAISLEGLRFLMLFILFFICLMPLFGSTYNPFIYFRF